MSKFFEIKINGGKENLVLTIAEVVGKMIFARKIFTDDLVKAPQISGYDHAWNICCKQWVVIHRNKELNTYSVRFECDKTASRYCTQEVLNRIKLTVCAIAGICEENGIDISYCFVDDELPQDNFSSALEIMEKDSEAFAELTQAYLGDIEEEEH